MFATTPRLKHAAERFKASAASRGSSCCYVVVLLAVLAIILEPTGAQAGPAVGQFEMKDLDAEVGEVELQSQNAFFYGNPRRRFVETGPGEFAFEENTVERQRNALEIEMTLTSFFRLRFGIEYEKERFDDAEIPLEANQYGAFELSEVAVEGVVILVPVKGDGIGFGMLTEYESPTGGDEQKTLVFGPIIEARRGPYSAIVNLTLTRFFGGGDALDPEYVADDKWDFSYAAQVKYAASASLAFAIEAYGTIDRIGSTGRPSAAAQIFGDDDQHRIGPLVYYSFELGAKASGPRRDDDHDSGGPVALSGDDDRDAPTATIGLGLLFGLTDATADATLKASLEVEF